jgi:hypothetical protein
VAEPHLSRARDASAKLVGEVHILAGAAAGPVYATGPYAAPTPRGGSRSGGAAAKAAAGKGKPKGGSTAAAAAAGKYAAPPVGLPLAPLAATPKQRQKAEGLLDRHIRERIGEELNAGENN